MKQYRILHNPYYDDKSGYYSPYRAQKLFYIIWWTIGYSGTIQGAEWCIDNDIEECKKKKLNGWSIVKYYGD